MAFESSDEKRVLGNRWMWMPAIMAIGMLIIAWWLGQLAPRIEPDSHDYIEFDFSTLKSALTGIRTPGYPLFVAAVKNSIGLDWMPLVHWGLYLLAVVYFVTALSGIGFRPVIAACIGTALVCSSTILSLAPAVLSDSLAVTLAIASVAALLRCLSPKSTWLSWSMLAGLVFACYLVRPAFLFMMLLVPLLAAWLDFWLLRRRDRFRDRWKNGFYAACWTFVPFLLYCTLRLVVVGDFGFVSFAGYNIVGIAGQAIDDRVVQVLNDDLKELAKDIQTRRDGLPNYQQPSSYEAMEAMFNPVVWQVAVPTARQRYGDDEAIINRKLKELSQRVLAQKPDFYRRWLLMNGKHAVGKILELAVRDWGTLLVLAALGLLIFVHLVFGSDHLHLAVDPTCDAAQATLELQVGFWIALSYCVSCTLLVILVEPSLTRYMSPAIVFWPGVIAMLAAHHAERLLVPTATDRDKPC